jgi:hypothetical protein
MPVVVDNRSSEEPVIFLSVVVDNRSSKDPVCL